MCANVKCGKASLETDPDGYIYFRFQNKYSRIQEHENPILIRFYHGKALV